jgi:hypothetical protein
VAVVIGGGGVAGGTEEAAGRFVRNVAGRMGRIRALMGRKVGRIEMIFVCGLTCGKKRLRGGWGGRSIKQHL